MNTDLELYRVFCEVVKHKNISKTAESMYISQSAITQSIQKLESILGGKVFYRNKNGVELTEEGRNLYEYIKNSIETMSNAENIFSQYTNLEKGKIRIGGGNSLVISLITEPLMKFMNKYPNIDISIESGITEGLMQKLANGELDMVILNLPYNKNYSNVEFLPLKKSNFCFFASKKYLKKNPIIEFKELESCTLILPKTPSAKRKMLDDYCKKEGIILEPKYEVSSSSITKKLVLNNIGIGFSKVESIEDVLNDVEIVKKLEFDNIKEGIATLKKNMVNKATAKLIEYIKEYYKQN